MFGRLGWAEILIIVVLVLILFSHNKIPAMMKNLADGLKVFKKELKSDKKDGAAEKVAPAKNTATKKTAAKAVKKNDKTAGEITYVELGAYASMNAAGNAQRKLAREHADLFADAEFVVLDNLAGGKHKFYLCVGFARSAAAQKFMAAAANAGLKCKSVDK